MKRLAATAASVAVWLCLAGPALAADVTPAAGPPYPAPVAGRAVYDTAGIFSGDTGASAEKAIANIQAGSGVAVVVYTQVKPESDTFWKADEDARALLEQWQVGGPGGNGLVILFDLAADRLVDNVSLVAGTGLATRISDADLSRVRYTDMETLIVQGRPDEALAVALARIQGLLAPPAGPPYPTGDPSRRIYDFAGIFKPATVAEAERIIAAIQTRTGAVVVVYTQVKPQSDSLDKANDDALALMNQWHIGRLGFDDGLVILFDMQANLRHGQVSLYAGAGYRAAFLSDSDRQAIFDDEMLPLLKLGDMDGGLMAALREVDANATPAHAAALERGRQVNALLIVGALLLGLLLIMAAVASWLRHGRDPVYLDDRSILMPAPPAGLTPAMATLILDDRTSRRTTSAALLDLAARGAIAFRQETSFDPSNAGIEYKGEGNDVHPPEARLLDSILKAGQSHDNYIRPSRLYRLIPAFDKLQTELEKDAVRRGWLREEPARVTLRWASLAGLEIFAGAAAAFMWLFFTASALIVLGVSLVAAGVATLAITPFMPARTKDGAVLDAQLNAYKRTLGYSMVQSGSMNEVVQRHAVPWIATPDQVMVWAAAFGLNRELELVLGRTAGGPGAESGGSAAWSPAWWTTPSSGGHSGGHGGGAGGISAGLFSSTPFPDPSSFMAALGSISSPTPPPSSSSSSGGSSFSSGSFGGGGGGGGGF